MVKKTFLIVKMSAIGDILHSLYVSQYLKKRFPDCFISWVVEKRFEECVKASPYVDEVISLDIKSLKSKPLKLLAALPSFRAKLANRLYDAVFDLQGNCKSALITLLCRAKDKVGFGVKSVAEWPNTWVTRIRFEIDPQLQIAKQYLSLIKNYFQDQEEELFSPHILSISGYDLPKDLFVEESCKQVMVCPGSNWVNKQLSENTLISFLQGIEKDYDPVFVFIWGNKKEEELAVKLNKIFIRSKIAGGLPLPLWQALMLKMQCVISVDSCALHLAALAFVPTFSIYGPSSSKVYKPLGQLHVAYQEGCPYKEQFAKRCKFLRTCTTAACIKKLPSNTLMRSFEAFLSKI